MIDNHTSTNNEFTNLMNYYENMAQHGFGLGYPLSPPPLIRTHKAYCTYCKGVSTSYTPYIRIVPCYFCVNVLIPRIQKNFRGFLVREKLRKLKKKELMDRWFMSNNINGSDFSHHIHSFL
jgi:hypothetical protein